MLWASQSVVTFVRCVFFGEGVDKSYLWGVVLGHSIGFFGE